MTHKILVTVETKPNTITSVSLVDEIQSNLDSVANDYHITSATVEAVALTTREPVTSAESQNFIDTGAKPIEVFVVVRETQSPMGYIDTDIEGIFTTEAAALKSAKEWEDTELEPNEDGENERVRGREDEWLEPTGDETDCTVNFLVVATTLEGL